MDKINSLQISFIFLSWNHTWMTGLIILVFMVQSNFFRRFLTMDYRFAIEFKLGEFPGQSKTFIFIFFKQFAIILTLCTELNLAGKSGRRFASSLEQCFSTWALRPTSGPEDF